MIFGDFGTASMTQPGVDCPASGSWENWCDCVFKGDAANLSKCRGWGPAAPWTDVGAGWRGIPKPGSWVASLIGGVSTIAAAPAAIITAVPNVIGGAINTGISTVGTTIQSGQQADAIKAAAEAQRQAEIQRAGATTAQAQMDTIVKVAAIGGGAVLLAVLALKFLSPGSAMAGFGGHGRPRRRRKMRR